MHPDDHSVRNIPVFFFHHADKFCDLFTLGMYDRLFIPGNIMLIGFPVPSFHTCLRGFG